MKWPNFRTGLLFLLLSLWFFLSPLPCESGSLIWPLTPARSSLRPR